MRNQCDDWGLGDFFSELSGGKWDIWGRQGGRRRRGSMFESGEMKFVILRLIREKPRHGYEVMKALEEKMGGCYTPSAGTVYPTLQLLEDQGYIRGIDTDGKKVYQITAEGEQYLSQNQHVLDEIFDRVRDTVRDLAGGSMGEMNSAFGDLARATYRRAWRTGPDHPTLKQVAEILRRATAEVEQAWAQP
jgi:DNA-binding PadR family transcriptional regulator